MNELKILSSEDGKYRCYKIAVKGRGKDDFIKNQRIYYGFRQHCKQLISSGKLII